MKPTASFLKLLPANDAPRWGRTLTCALEEHLTCALYLICAPSTHLRTFREEKVNRRPPNNLMGGGGQGGNRQSTASGQSIGWGGGRR